MCYGVKLPRLPRISDMPTLIALHSSNFPIKVPLIKLQVLVPNQGPHTSNFLAGQRFRRDAISNANSGTNATSRAHPPSESLPITLKAHSCTNTPMPPKPTARGRGRGRGGTARGAAAAAPFRNDATAEPEAPSTSTQTTTTAAAADAPPATTVTPSDPRPDTTASAAAPSQQTVATSSRSTPAAAAAGRGSSTSSSKFKPKAVRRSEAERARLAEEQARIEAGRDAEEARRLAHLNRLRGRGRGRGRGGFLRGNLRTAGAAAGPLSAGFSSEFFVLFSLSKRRK
jgi:hypothetical protein